MLPLVNKDGQPEKKRYRTYHVKGVSDGDDYGAMRQAVARRSARIAGGESPAPDLLLIDGGPGQLQSAARAAAAGSGQI